MFLLLRIEFKVLAGCLALRLALETHFVVSEVPADAARLTCPGAGLILVTRLSVTLQTATPVELATSSRWTSPVSFPDEGTVSSVTTKLIWSVNLK